MFVSLLSSFSHSSIILSYSLIIFDNSVSLKLSILELIFNKLPLLASFILLIDTEVIPDLSNLNIKMYELTRILGILLDNAIEACQKLPENERWIQVSIVRNFLPNNQIGSVYISVLNPSAPVKIVNQNIATTKPNASFHGFGLRNVKTILEKYGAEYDMAYENGMFAFSLDWPDRSL